MVFNHFCIGRRCWHGGAFAVHQLKDGALVMVRYALIAALLACLGLGAALWWVTGQRDEQLAEVARLDRELAVANMRAQQAKDAAAVHRAWIARAEAAAATAAATENEFLDREGGDAPLSDYLRDVLDRVR